ncbi:TRAP transporter small permease [Kaustia mangrovi]|uniref:TRAP transporter small permease protein n=1 Tax=Kaustia mangrovi TaxID=2593653 RepID=A0A7S8HBV6_9HYPH|nr:TRAP transporter small permease [Kaustia mangrovi]QPC42931.1 TRAP transporter small permease [Kaustia mangrovi]
MKRILSCLDRAVDAVLISALAVIIAVMVLQVAMRYFFHAALPWPEELAQFLLVALSLLGTYRAVGANLHVAVDAIPRRWHGRTLRALQAAGLVAAGLFLGYIAWGGWHLAMSAWTQPSTALRLPMALPYLVIPLSCGLCAAALLAKAWSRLAGDDEAEGADGEARS